MKSYVFHVHIRGEKDVWRRVELLETQTLKALHDIIQEAFDFGDDHLYSFYMSGKPWDKKTEYRAPDPDFDQLSDDLNTTPNNYEAFEDLTPEQIEVLLNQQSLETGIPVDVLRGMWESFQDDLHQFQEEDTRRTDRIRLSQLDLNLRKKFLYLFDYGAEWKFDIQLVQIHQTAEPADAFPRITDSEGDAPLQYAFEGTVAYADDEDEEETMEQLRFIETDDLLDDDEFESEV
jgi:hypothetical protein